MGRAPCCDKANVKKGPWSPEEDAKLRSYIQTHGTGGNWIALPRKIGLRRCGKSCRLRWLNYLRPDIRHGGFSQEEDNIICGLYFSIGSRYDDKVSMIHGYMVRWSVIASQLQGRTDNDIKNYWNTRLKKRFLGNGLNCNGVKRSDTEYMNMVRQGVSKDAVETYWITCNNSTIHDHDKRPYSAIDFPYNLPAQSLPFKDFLLRLEGQYLSSEEDSLGLMVDGNGFSFQPVSSSLPSASSMNCITRFGANQSETGFQAMQWQSEISCNDEFLLADKMTFGASNTGSRGYFTSLMTLAPSCPPHEHDLTVCPKVLR